MPGARLKALCILTHLILRAAVWGRVCCYAHFTGEDMEAQVIGDLPRVKKLAMEPGLKPIGADTGVCALTHWTTVPWKSCGVKGT